MTSLDIRRRQGAVVGVLLGLLGGCSGESEPRLAPTSTAAAPGSTAAAPVATTGTASEYLPGLEARFYPSTETGRAGLLVMSPVGDGRPPIRPGSTVWPGSLPTPASSPRPSR